MEIATYQLLIGFVLGFIAGFFIFRTKLRKVKRQASEDYLTKILNYRVFDRKLRQFLVRNRLENRHFSIALIDLDGFKTVNDKYGYEAGDTILQECAEIIRSNTRTGDLIFRYKHGDEFSVILPGTLREGALKVANRIKNMIKSHIFTVKGKNITLTSSIGLVSVGTSDYDKKSLIRLMEENLRKAKEKTDNVEPG